VQVIPQHAIKAMLVLSTRKIKTGRLVPGGSSWDATFFTTALGPYGGVPPRF
jgi:hypothetical protein